jgi:hypothetical protein
MNPLCGIIIVFDCDYCVIRCALKNLYLCKVNAELIKSVDLDIHVNNIVWFTTDPDSCVITSIGNYKTTIKKVTTVIQPTELYFITLNISKLQEIPVPCIPIGYITSVLRSSNVENVFILGEKFNQTESLTVEFKSFATVQLPTSMGSDIMENYIIGFLNSGYGGTLYFGIEDNCTISGTIKSTMQNQTDLIQRNLSDRLRKCTFIDPKMYKIEFYSVWNPKNQQMCDDRFIVCIKVHAVNNGIIYYNSKNVVYIKELTTLRELSTNEVSILMTNRLFYGNSADHEL